MTSVRIRFNILPFIMLAFLSSMSLYSQSRDRDIHFEFYGDTIAVNFDSSVNVPFSSSLSNKSISSFYAVMNAGNYQPLIKSLLSYKEKKQLNDWLYYQLIRRTAQQVSPKEENYHRYTLYKWFLLTKSGYDAKLALGNNQLIFYVRNDEDIYDIPSFLVDNKKYMCLNYHDYGKIDFEKDRAYPVDVVVPEATKAFSYKVTRMPDFKPEDYAEKELRFNYGHKVYHFKVMVNPQIQNIFANYPGVNFESYFNIPLSRVTYSSLIPVLKKNIKGMNQQKGVDYLMRFTRYAFLYEKDEDSFGKEKRLSPEQTLLYDYSDCDDRAALFFYLVKEIYDLPMIALLYPTHITIAVQFDKPVGEPIVYKGKKYSVCEPTPQNQDLPIGHIAAHLKNASYEVVYQYDPSDK